MNCLKRFFWQQQEEMTFIWLNYDRENIPKNRFLGPDFHGTALNSLQFTGLVFSMRFD